MLVLLPHYLSGTNCSRSRQHQQCRQNRATINVMLCLTQALYSLQALDKGEASHVHSHRVCITKMFTYNEVVKLWFNLIPIVLCVGPCKSPIRPQPNQYTRFPHFLTNSFQEPFYLRIIREYGFLKHFKNCSGGFQFLFQIKANFQINRFKWS